MFNKIVNSITSSWSLSLLLTVVNLVAIIIAINVHPLVFGLVALFVAIETYILVIITASWIGDIDDRI